MFVLRRLALTVCLSAVLLIHPVAGAAEGSLPPELMRDLIQKTLPTDALTGSIDRSSGVAEHHGSDPAQRPSDFLEAAMGGDARSLSNPRTLSRAQDALLQQVTGEDVPDLGSILEDHLQASATSHGGTSTTATVTEDVQVGFPVDDLDGDALADVAELWAQWDQATNELLALELRALSGKTGSQLWSRDLLGVYDFYLLQNGDLNQDGAQDLVLLELLLDESTFTGACTLLVCAGDFDYEFSWRLTPLSGTSGLPLWSKTYLGAVDATLASAGAFVAGAFAYRVTVTNALMALWVQESELVLNLFDFEGVFGLQYASGIAAFVYALEQIYAISTRGFVLEPDSGSLRFQAETDGEQGEAFLMPVGQAVGGPEVDFIWYIEENFAPVTACAFSILAYDCVGTRSWSATITMIDGNNFQRAWSTSFEQPQHVWIWLAMTGEDLDGDGGADLVLYEYSGDEVRVAALDGSTGEELWSLADPGDVYVIGPVGGISGADLIAIDYGSSDGGYSLTLARLDGGSGDELFSTTFTSSSQDRFTDYWAYRFGDADGDGTIDLMVGEYSYEESGTLTYTLESGRTGAVINTRSGPDSYLFAGGDLNGDGTADGLATKWRTTGSTYEFDRIAVALPSNTQMWTRTEVFGRDHYWRTWTSRAGDMSGVGGDDLLINQRQYIDDLQSRFLAVEGTTGATSWAVGDEFDLPIIHTGSISGTVTASSGEALPGICVSVSRVDDYFWVHVKSVVDGTFIAESLEDGTYRVRFDDCGTGKYQTQWYDGATEFADADTVVISEGQAATGVNAQMTALPDPSEYALLREEAHEYVGVGGDVIATPPYPGSLTVEEGCSGEGTSIGGTCFSVQGSEKAVELDIDDSRGGIISGYYLIRGDHEHYSGRFCGSTARILMPENSYSIHVWTETARSALSDCADPDVPTTGTITAKFYG